MNTSRITYGRQAIARTLQQYVKPGREPMRIASLFDLCCAHDAVEIPDRFAVYCEQSRKQGVTRLRLIVAGSERKPPIGVTRLFDLNEIAPAPENVDSAARAVKRIVREANDLLAARQALEIGLRRVKEEVDYSDPKNLIELLTDRGCTILDEDAVGEVVATEPGPLYYGDIELDADGSTWEQAGGPWADRLQAQLVRRGAVIAPSDAD